LLPVYRNFLLFEKNFRAIDYEVIKRYEKRAKK